MKKCLLGLCAAAVTSVSMAATLDLKPASLQRGVPAPETGLSFVMAPELQGQHANAMFAPAAGNDMESMNFSLAFTPYTAMSLGPNGVGLEIYMAFEVTPEVATRYAGATVKSINVTTGVNGNSNTNNLTNVTVYLMDDLNATPFMVKKGTVGTGRFTEYKVALDQEYTIEAGKGFVVAYSVVPVAKTDYYVVVDGLPRATSEGCYIGVKQQGQMAWEPYGDQVGNLCLGLTLESETLPHDGVNLLNVELPPLALKDKPFNTDIYFYGDGANDATSMEIEYTIGNSDPQTLTWTLDDPVGFNELFQGTIGNMVCSETGVGIPMKFTITKVNGVDNTGLSPTFETEIDCINEEDGFKRVLMCEEGTGTWCGYCPAGIVFMEYLKENYPENVIRVAVHGDDEMQVNSASSLLEIFEGFPMVYINRSYELSPTAKEVLNDFEGYYKSLIDIPTLVEISDLTAKFDEEKEISVSAKTRFAIDMDNDQRYGVSFALTQDGIGPYLQTNYYSGQNVLMGGWENKREKEPMMYDDVLRELVGGLSGYTDAFPENVTKGTEYETTDFIPLRNVSNANFFVTAMVIDNKTGEIVNAKQIAVENPYWAGVEGVFTDAAVVKGGEGRIELVGDYAEAMVYDFGGVKVAEAYGAAEIALPAGLYIVNIDGRAVKVAVK